jgi:hypothetical protein
MFYSHTSVSKNIQTKENKRLFAGNQSKIFYFKHIRKFGKLSVSLEIQKITLYRRVWLSAF